MVMTKVPLPPCSNLFTPVWLGAASFLAATLPLSLQAAVPLMIWPVDPVITAEQQAVAIWVENRGLQTASLQARVMEWTQVDGEEQFTPQKEVVVSPPISTIPVGKRQMIRLIATQPAPPDKEKAYRLVMDELPAPADQASPQATGQASMGIQLQVRYAIPLFVYGSGAQPYRPAKPLGNLSFSAKSLPPALSWRIAKEDKRHRLVVHNRGMGHARITAVQWGTGHEGSVPINEGLMGYVLPNSYMRWELEKAPPADPVLKATINGVETVVPRAAQ